MSNQLTPSAKEKVLAWVRERNPETMDLKFGCRVKDRISRTFIVLGDGKGRDKGKKIAACTEGGTFVLEASQIVKILGSDMGWQELCTAINKRDCMDICVDVTGRIWRRGKSDEEWAKFDMKKNAHDQDDSFYKQFSRLIDE